jgi:HD-GYP domain-containing protein (c-di-GMP phosphodiesterase class II)
MRVAELMGVLSLASDAAMGMPAEHGLRAAAAAVRIGEIAGATEVERADAFYVALMRYAGCTADSDLAADVLGDEIAMRGALYGVDFGDPIEVMPRVARAAAQGKRGFGAASAAIRTIAKMPKLMNSARSHCEVGDRLAERFGFGSAFRTALLQSFERWDGRGWPEKRAGESLAVATRLAHLGEGVETAHRVGGVNAARAVAKKRAGRELDPNLVARFDARAADVCAVFDVASAWDTAMAAEPRAWREVDEEGLDEALRAIGDFAGMKSRYTRAHASGVARLARAAAERARLDEASATTLARAAFVHDLGRVAVSASIWDKPGPLTDLEWERIRMHTYVGERILSRAPGLTTISDVATLAHERLDGSGYHRRLDASSCKAPARLLAAADVYHAMTEDRPQRRALTPDQAAREIEEMARRGALCPDATRAVLWAAGHAPKIKRERPADLTDREVDVLCLVARGLTNKEIGTELQISTKTVGNHLQNIFQKIGVTTRAAATMFAMQKRIVGD